MGPQLDSCGRLRVIIRQLETQKLQWGRNLIVAEGQDFSLAINPNSASMGPQLDSCGRSHVDHLKGTEENELQWGRNLIVAEGLNLIQSPQTYAAASMGPQLDSCGRMNTSTGNPVDSEGFNGAAT